MAFLCVPQYTAVFQKGKEGEYEAILIATLWPTAAALCEMFGGVPDP